MLQEIVLPDRLTRPHGLKEAHLRNLQSVVVLAGPNGGGKSRYLKLLGSVAAWAQSPAVLAHEIDRTSELIEVYRNWGNHEQAAQAESKHQDLLGQQEAVQSATFVPQVQPFVFLPSIAVSNAPTSPAESRPSHFRMPGTVTNAVARFDISYTLAHLHLDGVARALFMARHPDHEADPQVLKNAELARSFNRILYALLGTEVEYTPGGPLGSEPLLFGRPVHFQQLSSGQKVLLTWAIALSEQAVEGGLEDAIIAIDEPELYLHPSAAIDVLDRLRTNVLGEHGQLFIATHSPALVAHFHWASIYDVRDNSIAYSSTRVEQVMNGLLGGDDARQRLRDLMDEAEHAAFLRFAAQCLDPAHVAEVSGDPQSDQLSRLCQRMLETNSRLRVLDYGSGKGRFARALAQNLDEQARSGLDYCTWDDAAHNEHQDERALTIKELYPDEEDVSKRMSTEISDYFHEQRVHLVVMCNFLHEIPPEEWRHHLCHAHDSLTDDGLLLILEDQEIPVGELPHRGGFLILDIAEMRTLLQTTDLVQQHQVSDPRCSAIIIQREALQHAHDKGAFAQTLRAALEKLQGRMVREIKQLRENSREHDHKSGRKHARLAIQHTNATWRSTDSAPHDPSCRGRPPVSSRAQRWRWVARFWGDQPRAQSAAHHHEHPERRDVAGTPDADARGRARGWWAPKA